MDSRYLSPEHAKAVWDQEKDPELPLELLDYRQVMEGLEPHGVFQTKLKKLYEENFEKFMREKRILEKEYKEWKKQEDKAKAEDEDQGTEMALKVAREWLKRHGEKALRPPAQ